MSDSSNKTKTNETPACCCFDVGTIIDNDDCVVKYDNLFVSEAEAKTKLAELVQVAKDVESDPCEIKSSIEKTNSGFRLAAAFTFCCGTESMIFQLKLR